jgi:hypothetical protein
LPLDFELYLAWLAKALPRYYNLSKEIANLLKDWCRGQWNSAFSIVYTEQLCRGKQNEIYCKNK